MIAHIVLFEPRRNLSPEQREAFAVSFERALAAIPQIRRARVGERRNQARLYDRLNTRDFPYFAIIEFDNEADLRTYLDHPAHDALGRLFYETSESALAFDFALSESENAGRLFRGALP
jgi:Stress responsive A/B Barrel Domain